MTNTQDILTDESGDIQFTDGDINWGNGAYQHQRELLTALKGSHKQAPASGVGMVDFVNDESPENMVKMIRTEFKSDGMMVNNIEIEENKLRIDANY